MTLVDDILWALPDMQAEAEATMVDFGVMRRSTGPMVQDPVTDRESPEYDDLFISPCKLQSSTAGFGSTESEVGARTVVTVRVELHLPVSSPAVQVGDVFEVTAAGPLSTARVGQRLRVTAPFVKSFATAMRLQVEEVVS